MDIVPQALGSVARLAVTSLVDLCDALEHLRYSTAQADILTPLSVQCDVTLSLLLQRSEVARSLLLHNSITRTLSGNTSVNGNHPEVHRGTIYTGSTTVIC